MDKKTVIGLSLIVVGFGAYYYFKKKKEAADTAAANAAVAAAAPAVVVSAAPSTPYREEFKLVVPPYKGTIPATIIGEELRQRAYAVDSTKVKAPFFL
jgi:hypothetical protein